MASNGNDPKPPVECVLVTGGAGYVGSHTVVKLLEGGYDVVVVDNMSNCTQNEKTSQPESLLRAQALTGRRLTFYGVDINDEAALDAVFKKASFTTHSVDCVLHFAALKSVSESCQIPMTYYRNNVAGTLALVKVMTDNNVKRAVYSSSSTVYGTPQCLPLDEGHPTGQGCTNPYGKSKFMVEEMFKDLCSADKCWRVISLRYFNPVGAHESGRLGEDPLDTPNNLMPYVAQVAVGRRPKLRVYGDDYPTSDGTGVRDYIHIDDLAEGHLRALERMFSAGLDGFRPYNLGTGKGHSVLEVVQAFSEACGKKIPYEIAPRREGDIAASYCDASLAKRDLGWAAKKDLKEMCKFL
ncbi:hypothetical protein AAG570_007336 [Ranatra chinensis]|uniref:UDP-glucose 4-epimerase n=1 Tax=Ranatra chinensis TaxID=642074 RepID=A0ABD0XXG9_9HEMI